MRNVNVLPKLRVELRNPKDLNAKGESALRYVVRLKGEGKISRATGLTVKPEIWNSKKQAVSKMTEEGNRINKIIACKKADFDSYFLKMSVLGKRISMKLVSEYFNEKRFDSLFGYFDALLEQRTEENERGTCVKDNVCRKRFEKFAVLKGYKKLKFADVNLSFLQEYDRYLVHNVKLQSSSARNDHKVLKVLFKSAVVDEILDRSPYLGFKPIKTNESTPKDILSVSDVERLRNLELSSPELLYLNKTRNLFLFMLNTGLRFSDVANARTDNFRSEQIDGETVIFLDVFQKKTKNPVDVFLNAEAKKMIRLIRADFESKTEPLIFGKLTLQPLNRNLKKLAKLIGTKKNLSTHVARHTFATYLHNALEIPVEIVSGGMGHKKTAMTKEYIRRNNLNLASKINELYVLKKVS